MEKNYNTNSLLRVTLHKILTTHRMILLPILKNVFNSSIKKKRKTFKFPYVSCIFDYSSIERGFFLYFFFLYFNLRFNHRIAFQSTFKYSNRQGIRSFPGPLNRYLIYLKIKAPSRCHIRENSIIKHFFLNYGIFLIKREV